MGRWKSLVVEVPLGEEDEVIRDRELFGWSLKSRQRVELGENGDDYVALHFVSDPDIPHWDTLRRLEEEYFDLKRKLKNLDESEEGLGCGCAIAIVFGGLIGAIAGLVTETVLKALGTSEEVYETAASVTFLVVLFVIPVWYVVEETRRRSEAPQYRRRLEEIEQEATALLDS